MQQVGAVTLLDNDAMSSCPPGNRPRYTDIAQWIYRQQRWVTRREIVQQFGLSRAAVASYLSVIAAKRPSVGLQQSMVQNRGSVSARILANPDIWMHGSTSASNVSLNPVPSSSEHARWLALVQLPWSKMATDDRFQGASFRCSAEHLKVG